MGGGAGARRRRGERVGPAGGAARSSTAARAARPAARRAAPAWMAAPARAGPVAAHLEQVARHVRLGQGQGAAAGADLHRLGRGGGLAHHDARAAADRDRAHRAPAGRARRAGMGSRALPLRSRPRGRAQGASAAERDCLPGPPGTAGRPIAWPAYLAPIPSSCPDPAHRCAPAATADRRWRACIFAGAGLREAATAGVRETGSSRVWGAGAGDCDWRGAPRARGITPSGPAAGRACRKF
jgi:hypothetical protein